MLAYSSRKSFFSPALPAREGSATYSPTHVLTRRSPLGGAWRSVTRKLTKSKASETDDSTNGKPASGASPLGSVRSEPVGLYGRPSDVSPLLLSPSASSAYGTAEHRAAFYANRARSREASRGSSPADSLPPSVHRAFQQSRSPDDPASARSASRTSARQSARLKVLAEGNENPRYGVYAGWVKQGFTSRHSESPAPRVEEAPKSTRSRSASISPEPARPSNISPALWHFLSKDAKRGPFKHGILPGWGAKLREASRSSSSAAQNSPPSDGQEFEELQRAPFLHRSQSLPSSHSSSQNGSARNSPTIHPLALPSSAAPSPGTATPERGRSRLVKSKRTKKDKKAAATAAATTTTTTTTTLATTSRTGLAAHARHIERWIQYHPPDDARAVKPEPAQRLVASDASPKTTKT
ncbi:hypothetical protein CBOM_03867 [Ceraceosorus bombacis]|uniref:Uncharacterized protein n=1 Tax=Ceraceosorus bombacis TaxID=401625 RepID=A0A0N7LA46_9BASI|nr:hypothetical protein CBOM_03867 [Ceraceosorus bombacis]